jgi:hypothetical protein
MESAGKVTVEFDPAGTWAAQPHVVGFRPAETPAQLRVNAGLLELLAKHAAAPDASLLQPHVQRRGLPPSIAAAKLQLQLGLGQDVPRDQRTRHPQPPAPADSRPRSTSPGPRLATAGAHRGAAQPDPLLKVSSEHAAPIPPHPQPPSSDAVRRSSLPPFPSGRL